MPNILSPAVQLTSFFVLRKFRFWLFHTFSFEQQINLWIFCLVQELLICLQFHGLMLKFPLSSVFFYFWNSQHIQFSLVSSHPTWYLGRYDVSSLLPQIHRVSCGSSMLRCVEGINQVSGHHYEICALAGVVHI